MKKIKGMSRRDTERILNKIKIDEVVCREVKKFE